MNIIQNFRNSIDVVAPKTWETVKKNSVIFSTVVFAAVITEIHGKEEFSAIDMTKIVLSSVSLVSSIAIGVLKKKEKDQEVRHGYVLLSEEHIETEKVEIEEYIETEEHIETEEVEIEEHIETEAVEAEEHIETEEVEIEEHIETEEVEIEEHIEAEAVETEVNIETEAIEIEEVEVEEKENSDQNCVSEKNSEKNYMQVLEGYFEEPKVNEGCESSSKLILEGYF